MKMTVLKIVKHQSKLQAGSIFYYLFAKGEDSKSYKTCLSSKYGNFNRWITILNKGTGTVFYDVKCHGRLIDADSFPKILKESAYEVVNELS